MKGFKTLFAFVFLASLPASAAPASVCVFARSYLPNCPLDWNVIHTNPIVLETSDDQYLGAYQQAIFMVWLSSWVILGPRSGDRRSCDDWEAIMPGIYWLNPGKLRPVPSPVPCFRGKCLPSNLHLIIKIWTVSMFEAVTKVRPPLEVARTWDNIPRASSLCYYSGNRLCELNNFYNHQNKLDVTDPWDPWSSRSMFSYWASHLHSFSQTINCCPN